MIAASFAARKRQLVIVFIGLAAAIAVAGFAAGYAYAAQPRMEAALGYLQSARGELQAAERDKGGHRVAAIRLIDRAIHEVRAGIAVGGS